jgi:hypothetical protein
MGRKIVQITTSVVDGRGYLYALADDGSLWGRPADKPSDQSQKWVKLFGLPALTREEIAERKSSLRSEGLIPRDVEETSSWDSAS